MKNLNKKHILVILLLLAFCVFQLSSREQEKQSDLVNQNSVYTWDAETSSFKEYASYDESVKEMERKRQVELEKYNNAIKRTIVEKVQNVNIPSYYDDNEFMQLKQGYVEVRGQKNDDFPNGVLLWYAYLTAEESSFIVGDFNKDGLDDVAHVIGYTGGGSGVLYYLAIFINNQGKLKHLTQKLLGDGIFTKNVKYKSGEFLVDIITQGEGDDFMGYCCPNTPMTIKLKLEDNKLVEI